MLRNEKLQNGKRKIGFIPNTELKNSLPQVKFSAIGVGMVEKSVGTPDTFGGIYR